MIRLLVLVLIFATVILAVEGVVNWVRRSRSEGRAINERLTMIGRGYDRGQIRTTLRRERPGSGLELPGLLGKIVRSIDRMTVGARLHIAADRLLLLLAGAMAAVLLLCLVLARLSGITMTPGGLLMIGLFAFVIGFVLPLMIISNRSNAHRKKLEAQFPVALDVFVRGLRAGHPIAAALELLTVEMPDPIGSELGMVIDEVTYGADLRDALEGMAERWDLDDMRMFVVSLSVQSETGGNLAEILENLSKVIRDRASMMLKVRALSSEGRMTAVMLTGLPVFAFVALFLVNPAFYLDVAADPAFLPGFAGLLILYSIGFFAIRRLVNLKV
jgi:tight adherence protein B